MPSRVITTTEEDSGDDEPILISQVIESTDDIKVKEPNLNQDATNLTLFIKDENCSNPEQHQKNIPEKPKRPPLGFSPTVIKKGVPYRGNKDPLCTLQSTLRHKKEEKKTSSSFPKDGQPTIGFFFSQASKSATGSNGTKKIVVDSNQYLPSDSNRTTYTGNPVSTSTVKRSPPILKESLLKSNAKSRKAPWSKPTSKRTKPNSTTQKKSKSAAKKFLHNSSINKTLQDPKIMSIVLGNSYPMEKNCKNPLPSRKSPTRVGGIDICALLPELVTREIDGYKKMCRVKKNQSRGKTQKSCNNATGLDERESECSNNICTPDKKVENDKATSKENHTTDGIIDESVTVSTVFKHNQRKDEANDEDLEPITLEIEESPAKQNDTKMQKTNRLNHDIIIDAIESNVKGKGVVDLQKDEERTLANKSATKKDICKFRSVDSSTITKPGNVTAKTSMKVIDLLQNQEGKDGKQEHAVYSDKNPGSDIIRKTEKSSKEVSDVRNINSNEQTNKITYTNLPETTPNEVRATETAETSPTKVANGIGIKDIALEVLEPPKIVRKIEVSSSKDCTQGKGTQLPSRKDQKTCNNIQILNSINQQKLPTKAKADIKKKEVLRELTKEEESVLARYAMMEKLYVKKIRNLVELSTSSKFVEEIFQREAHEKESMDVNLHRPSQCTNEEFRDEWLPTLALVVQGSPLSLNALAKVAHEKITSKKSGFHTGISIHPILSKIKLVASRTSYLSPFPSFSSASDNVQVDIYSDTDVNHMWRWEISSLDLLSHEHRATVKKARSARKRIKCHQKSMLRLLTALKDAAKHIRSSSTEKWDSKINAEEEKVMKYEREHEKIRLIQEAKVQKDIEKALKLQEQQKEKAKLVEEKRKIKALKEKQKQRKEKEAVELKKRKEAVVAEEEEQAKKRKHRMMSFFNKPLLSSKNNFASNNISIKSPTERENIRSQSYLVTSNRGAEMSKMESERIWTVLGSDDSTLHNNPTFLKLSNRAKLSRKKQTQRVCFTVFVTVASDNTFEQQPYDEERRVFIRNKYKYLSFHEDHRPPYYGTWSKQPSSVVNGRNPFGEDTTNFDYDFDSEAEWEEGDDEQGEDCSVNDDDDDEIDDEEGDSRKYNYQDGWLAQDDDLGPQDDDDGEIKIRKKRTETSNGSVGTVNGGMSSFPSVVAPITGGLPQVDQSGNFATLDPHLTQGIGKKDAFALIVSHDTKILRPSIQLCLDAYPPVVEPDERGIECASGSRNSFNKTSTKDLSDEDLKVFAKFVHNCRLKSKDMVVEALRSTHKNLTSSRAQATRKLDSIATKRRLKPSGVIWEVKDNILTSLGLQDLIVVKEEPKQDKDSTKSPYREKIENSKITSPKTSVSPARVSPSKVTPPEASGKKRKVPHVSAASVNLLAAFLKKKRKL